jgi:hypothetical protein
VLGINWKWVKEKAKQAFEVDEEYYNGVNPEVEQLDESCWQAQAASGNWKGAVITLMTKGDPQDGGFPYSKEDAFRFVCNFYYVHQEYIPSGLEIYIAVDSEGKKQCRLRKKINSLPTKVENKALHQTAVESPTTNDKVLMKAMTQSSRSIVLAATPGSGKSHTTKAWIYLTVSAKPQSLFKVLSIKNDSFCGLNKVRGAVTLTSDENEAKKNARN